MRYVIIINPAAGTKSANLKYRQIFEDHFQKLGVEHQIYVSEHPDHIAEIAKAEAERHERLRIWVAGGDGSVFSLANAIKAYPHVEMGVFPCGSGNDFVKNFDPSIDFFDIDGQLNGESKRVNLIDSNIATCINVASIGFDAGVCYHTVAYKKLPFGGNTMRYNLALLKMLFTNYGNTMHITLHSKGETHSYHGNFLFVLAANGTSYGGGYKAAPDAKIDDDQLTFVLLKTPSLFKILSLIGKYKKGKHLNNPLFAPYLVYMKGDKLEFESDDPVFYNLDGECDLISKGYFSLSKNTVQFIVPVLKK